MTSKKTNLIFNSEGGKFADLQIGVFLAIVTLNEFR